MAGTSGNLGWAESGANVPVEPSDALKADGYAPNEIPSSAHWNWLLREHGRAAVRRFTSTEALIRARRSGTGGGVETGEDVGLVLPFYHLGGFFPPPWGTPAWGQLRSDADHRIASDGEYLWVTHDNGAGHYSLRCLDRQTGVELYHSDETFDWTLVATAGGNLYTLHTDGGTLRIQARSRAVAGGHVGALLYEHDMGALGTPQAVATDGALVAVCVGTKVWLLHDTGAALVDVASSDHGASLFALAMDGRRLVIGGVDSAGTQIRSFAYSISGLVSEANLNRGPATVYHIDLDGERILWAGDPDAGHYAGLFRSPWETTQEWTWDTPVINAVDKHGACCLVGDYAVLTSGGYTILLDLRTGKTATRIAWGGGGLNETNRLAWDNDALFVLGHTGTGTERLKRYESRNQPRLFAVQASPFSLSRPVHSLVQLVR